MKNNIYFFVGMLVSLGIVLWLKGAGNNANEIAPKYVSDNIAKIVLIDVREPAELKSDGYIKGAVNIPLGTVQSQTAQIPKDKEVVVYCHSGRRSANAVEQLKQLGYTNVKSMAGGITAWKAQGFPVVQ